MKKYLETELGGFPNNYATSGDDAYSSMLDVMRELIAEPSEAMVNRILDDAEISALRADYTSLYENDRVECERELADLAHQKAALEVKLKDAKDKMASIMQRINDYVRTINDGYLNEKLNKEESFKVCVDGHILHYTYTGDTVGVFTLAKVEEMSVSDNSIFALQTNNQERFIHHFGVNFNELGHFESVEVTRDTMMSLCGRKLAASATFGDATIDRDVILDENMVNDILPYLSDGTYNVVIYAEAN